MVIKLLRYKQAKSLKKGDAFFFKRKVILKYSLLLCLFKVPSRKVFPPLKSGCIGCIDLWNVKGLQKYP